MSIILEGYIFISSPSLRMKNYFNKLYSIAKHLIYIQKPIAEIKYFYHTFIFVEIIYYLCNVI